MTGFGVKEIAMNRILTVVLIWCFGAVATAPAVDVDSLLVKMVGGNEAVGTLENMTGYTAIGAANINGLTGSFIEYYMPPNRFFLEVSTSGLTLVQAYDGTTAWQRDHNGRVSEVGGFEKREILKSLYMESGSFVLDDRFPGSAEILGDTTFSDTTFHKIALYPFNRDTIVLLLDSHEAQRRYMIGRVDQMTMITRFMSYDTLAGVIVPLHARSDIAGTPMFTEFIIDSVGLNGDIDPDIFRMPTDGTADFRFSRTSKAVTVPFEYRQGHIWIEATINGSQKAWFLLDSGSSANLFHAPAIADLNLPTTGSLPVMGLGGYENVDLVRSDSIAIGSLVLLDQIAGSIDLTSLGISAGSDRTLGGILGYDFLSRFPVLVDYQASALTVFNPRDFEPDTGGTTLDFFLTLLVPTVTGTVAGTTGDFIVDLGNSYGLVLHQRFVEANGLDATMSEVEEAADQMGGLGGRLSGTAGRVSDFHLGDITLFDEPVIVPAAARGLADSRELAGNIGNMILERYRVLFDYDRSQITLYPRKAKQQ